MVSKNQDDKLPAGWKVQIRVKNSRKYKCYTNKKTNKKFYSKLAVLRHIKDRSIGNESSSTMKGNTKKSSAKKQLHIAQAVEANDLHEWLPNGWIMELRTRKTGPKKGTMYKCFIDPATGSTFYSKPEVDRYLESSKSNAGLSQQREKGSSRHSSNNRFPDPSSPFNSCVESNVFQLSKTRVQKSNSVGKRKVVVETTIDNELPRGWIKEIRHKMIAKGVVRRDPFYMDPTGLVFRSKRDALRYIRTGEISKHAYRRKNGSINGEEFAVVKTSPPASDGKEKATETATRKQLFTDKVSPKQCISSPSEASGIKEAGSKRITRSSSRVASLDHSSVLLRPEEMSPGKSLTEKTDATGVTKGMTKVPLPKVQDDDATYRESKRITRSSLRVAGLDRSNVLLQPADSGQQMSRGKSLTEKIDATEVTKGMTKVPLRKAQDDDGEKDDATHRESKRITRSSSRVANLDHSSVLLQPENSALEMSRGKSLTEKIDATEVSKGMTKVPLPKVQDDSGKKDDATLRESKRVTRSSLRVANLDHSSALLQPANSAEEMSPGNALAEKIDATEMTEGLMIVPLPKVQDDDGMKHDATHRESKPSAVSSNDMLIEEKPETVAMKSCRKMRARTSKRKIKDREMASRSSKRRTGVGAEVVYHSRPIEHASRATNQNPRKVRADSSLGSTPSESRDKPQSLDFIAQNGLPAPQDELLRSPNTDAQTVLATQAGPSKLCFQPEIDLLEQYPPGFSQNPRIESSPIRTDQYPPGFYQNPRIESSPIRKDQSVDPKDTFMGSKIENSPANIQLAKEHPKELRESRFENSPGVDPIQVEQPSMAETVMEHLESQFCFPSPLWSDPCLEFAYKTLTGAISLDDSLAIDDYIQHQIRTSAEQSNNNRSLRMGVPSDETKPISPVPRDTGIPKSNGFGSQRTSR